MTKIIILGQEEPKRKSNKIQFVKILTAGNNIESIRDNTESGGKFNFIELVAKGYSRSNTNSDRYDLIFCYDDKDRRGDGCLFLGHFNDGVV